jgi:DNA-binding NarL/FixJ family response regulator
MIRVLLVDDHVMIRAGLERLLDQDPGIDVVGVADRGARALELDAELQPDVVVMDISMPDMDGIETTRRLITERAEASVVMLTAHTDRERVLDAVDAGALGYLVKDADPASLLAGIHAAANGDAPVDPRAARAVIDARARPVAPALTDRETEVLILVAQGEPNKVIARRLMISEKTVKAHLTRVFAALGVTDRTQAALWAVEHGLSEPARRTTVLGPRSNGR